MIKKYLEFIKEEADHKHEYGCVMLDLDIPNWKEIQSEIHPDDLYHHPTDDSYGLEDNPHLTILYGTRDNEIEQNDIIEKINEFKSMNLSFDVVGLDIFSGNDYDVVKFNVEKNRTLQEMFDQLSKFPNSNKFQNYSPHITLAYVKSGMGKKYIDSNKKLNYKIKDFIYSKSSGEKIII